MPEETRERIVDAAYRTLAGSGYERTSIKDIAAAAGVAPGLVHYYFKNKEELLVAAIEFACRDMLLVDATDPESSATELLMSLADRVPERRRFFEMFFDMVGVGLHNPAVMAAVRSFVLHDRGETEAVTRTVLDARGLTGVDARPIAAAVWAGIVGLALQAMVDPELDLRAAVAAYTAMVMTADPAWIPAPRAAGGSR